MGIKNHFAFFRFALATLNCRLSGSVQGTRLEPLAAYILVGFLARESRKVAITLSAVRIASAHTVKSLMHLVSVL